MELITAHETFYACPTLVSCPAAGCRAPAGQPCAAPRTHSARFSRAINRHRRDARRQHERAWRAQQRVRRAITDGETPAAGDVTTSLACACRECIPGHGFGFLLYQAGLL